MKNVYFLLLVASLLSPQCTHAQKGEEQAIRAILERQSTAWNKGSLEDFMKGYWENDSLMFIGKNWVTYGWENTLNNYKKSYPDKGTMGKLTFTLLHIKQLSPQYQQVIGKWSLQREEGKDAAGHFTLLFRKINKHWVIISDHSS